MSWCNKGCFENRNFYPIIGLCNGVTEQVVNMTLNHASRPKNAGMKNLPEYFVIDIPEFIVTTYSQP